MARATIATIADAAGVSTATVDRALNGRAGVSAANRQRVFNAARDLGYLPMEGMVRMPARPVRLAFLIPMGQNAFMRDITRAITEFAAALPLVEDCAILPLDGIGPDSLDRALEALPADVAGLGVITTDHPRARRAIGRLCDGGIRVVTIASDVMAPRKSAYVGVDNRAAGRTAAQLLGMMTGGETGSVALFLGSHDFHGHRERAAGFLAFVAERCPGLNVLPAVETGEMAARARTTMRGLLREVRDLRGIYCVGAGRRGIVEALEEAGLKDRRPSVVLHDLTDTSRRWLQREQIDAVIDQNARLVGEQAVTRVLGAIAAASPLLPVKDIEARVILRENLPG